MEGRMYSIIFLFSFMILLLGMSNNIAVSASNFEEENSIVNQVNNNLRTVTRSLINHKPPSHHNDDDNNGDKNEAKPADTGIYYTVTQTLMGLSVTSYNTSKSSIESVLYRVIAKSMVKISATEITIMNFYEPKPIWSIQYAAEQQVESTNMTDSHQVTIVYQVTIPSVQTIGYDTADEAYAATKNFLLTSVSHGLFTNDTQSDAHVHTVTALYHTQAIELPVVSSYSVLLPDFFLNAAVLIIILFFFIILLIACCGFILCCIPVLGIMFIFCPSQLNWLFGYRTGSSGGASTAAYQPLPTSNSIEMVSMGVPVYTQSTNPMSIPVTTQYAHTHSALHGQGMTVSAQGNYSSSRPNVMYTAVPTSYVPSAPLLQQQSYPPANAVTVTGLVIQQATK